MSPQSATIYTVSGANGSCAASATVEVAVSQTTSPQVNAATPVCYGQSVTLKPDSGNTYSWQPLAGIADAHAPAITVRPLVNTVYTVAINRAGLCATKELFPVEVYPVPHVYAGRDTLINREESVTLYGSGDVDVGFFSFSAEPLACNLCPSLLVSPSETTCYLLKGENAYGCLDLDTVCVQVVRSYELYFPNSFTPNGDGLNDVFAPVSYNLAEIRLSIFDRWGTPVFTGDENSAGWDGSFKRKPCEQGVYVYRAEAKTPAGNTIIHTGHVSLMP